MADGAEVEGGTEEGKAMIVKTCPECGEKEGRHRQSCPQDPWPGARGPWSDQDREEERREKRIDDDWSERNLSRRPK